MRYLDSLKIIAAFAVVVTHIASIGWQALPVSDDQWFVTSVWEIASRFCVPIFFMCSGAVLLSDKRTIPPSRLLKHYILRTCLIALFASAAFVSLQCFVYGWNGFRAFVYAVADGPYFIWYLWVLVSLSIACFPSLQV